jgi:hypothetical protein
LSLVAETGVCKLTLSLLMLGQLFQHSFDEQKSNKNFPENFQTGDINYKGRSDQIKDLRRDVMNTGRNESRDVPIQGYFKQ